MRYLRRRMLTIVTLWEGWLDRIFRDGREKREGRGKERGTYNPPPRNMTITPSLRCQPIFRTVNCFMGRAMTIKSKMMFIVADAHPSAFKSRHFPWCSPSHFFQAMLTGIHCKAVTVTKVVLYNAQMPIMA
jgi:hypothetical protein